MGNYQDIVEIGVFDNETILFEGQFPIPEGISYNSYVIIDEKIAVMDSVDVRFADQWLSNLESALQGKTPDYLVIQHMEPDHSGSIQQFIQTYPQTKLVGNTKTFTMLKNYFGSDYSENQLMVKNGDTLPLGSRTLTFVFAPMVHWPEVMMTYDSASKILFSADAFGTFGPRETTTSWINEARRYYFGIVAPYGKQVQALFKKLTAYDIQALYPLHGPVLESDISPYIAAYKTWSTYEAEEDGVTLVYSSVYGHTEKAINTLVQMIKDKGRSIAVFDLSTCIESEAIASAFRYKTLVCGSLTYNGSAFPAMKSFLEALAEKKYQNRNVAFIQNGSWAPMATKAMKEIITSCKDLTLLEPEITIEGAMTNETIIELEKLAEVL